MSTVDDDPSQRSKAPAAKAPPEAGGVTTSEGAKTTEAISPEIAEELSALRGEIDAIDREILERLNRRARHVQRVGELKEGGRKGPIYVAARERDPWTIAQAIERSVHQYIREKDFTQAFSTAAEVVRTRQGDCTEHAVLLAALCRARGIPARVAIGLVYHAPFQGFAYHMWNEAWIKDRWIPLDATLGLGGIGAAHLKIADADLQGTGAFGAFLSVLQVIGQLELEIESVSYEAQ